MLIYILSVKIHIVESLEIDLSIQTLVTGIVIVIFGYIKIS